MARYYFHLHGDTGVLRDAEGSELSIDAAIDRTTYEVRALIAAEALEGRIDLRQRLDVEDVNGVIFHSLTFADAVQIIH